MKSEQYVRAFETRDMNEFIDIMTPVEWSNLAKVFKTMNMQFTDSKDWCPAWSDIPLTIRGTSENYLDMAVRSSIFRFHDLIHNLWPQPTTLNNYLRVQIDGEIAALTVAEMLYPRILFRSADEEVKKILMTRDSMYVNTDYMTAKEIALYMRSLLCPINGGIESYTDSSHRYCQKFVDYFKKMLKDDYDNILSNIELLNGFDLGVDMNISYGSDPLLTMIENFCNILSGVDNVVMYLPKQRVHTFPNNWK